MAETRVVEETHVTQLNPEERAKPSRIAQFYKQKLLNLFGGAESNKGDH